MGQPIARIGDRTDGTCYHPSHLVPLGVGGTIITGSPNVFTNNIPTARLGDLVETDCGHIGKIITGSTIDITNNILTARLGDNVATDAPYVAIIVTGSTDVIGDPGDGNPKVEALDDEGTVGFVLEIAPENIETPTADQPEPPRGGAPGGGAIAPSLDGGPVSQAGNADVASPDFEPGPPGNCTRADLGKVSERYESNGNPSAIGNDSTGGWSYGTYQIATKVGTFKNYMNYLNSQFPRIYGILDAAGGNAGASAGTAKFKQQWKDLKGDAEFKKCQHDFIQATHHDKLIAKVKKATGVDICDGSHCNGLQDAAWSISVQHGPGSSIVRKGIVAARASNPNPTDVDFSNAIYNERDRVDVYFKRSTPGVKASVARRFKKERQDCLAICAI